MPDDSRTPPLRKRERQPAVTMAEAAPGRTDQPVVECLATAVATAQPNGQQVMHRMLNDLGASRPRPQSEAGGRRVGGEH